MSAAVYDEPYRLPAGILAVVVHGAFFALLYFGFAWQAQPVGTMSVELWQSLPDVVDAPPARPRVEEPVPEPPPPPPPEKVLEPEVAPPPPEKVLEPEVAPPQPEKTPPPEKVVEPEIVVPDEKAKAEKARIERERAEQAKAEKAKAEKARIEKARIEKARAEKARAERIAELAARERAEQAAQARAEQAATIGRMVDEHIGKIIAKIRRNIVMPPDVADDARAEFAVTLLPGGRVLSARLTRSSGNAAYDNAVERAIIKAQPLPLPADAALFNRFRELKLVFRPVE